MKRPDLLILVAIWLFITAFGALAGIFWISVYAFPAMLGVWGESFLNVFGLDITPIIGGVTGLAVGIAILACYAAISIVGGIGMLTGKEWGRITGIVCAALNMPNFPVGTTLGVLSIIYLTKPEVKNYFASRKTAT